jgi:hypothetical protein
MDERTQRISLRAYEIWERLGRPEGRHLENWLAAEREIDAEATDNHATRSDADDDKSGGVR